jgi:hypothetical protein
MILEKVEQSPSFKSQEIRTMYLNLLVIFRVTAFCKLETKIIHRHPIDFPDLLDFFVRVKGFEDFNLFRRRHGQRVLVCEVAHMILVSPVHVIHD